MNNLVVTENRIPAMSAYAIDKVRALESCSAALLPQVNIATWHVYLVLEGVYAGYKNGAYAGIQYVFLFRSGFSDSFV